VTHRRQHDQPPGPADEAESPTACLSRREFFKSAGATGLAAAASPLVLLPGDANAAPADGTPEQIHLTWGDDPSSSVVVFDLDPGIPHGKTSITIRYYHAPGADQVPTSDYELFETLVVAKDRRDEEHR
jgi:hypothetical protein